MEAKQTGRHRPSVPSPCTECGRVFSRKDSLARHLKTHEKNLEQRPAHRIIRQNFRACKQCRRTKVRCTGSAPCARCQQTRQECHYDQKGQDQSILPTTSSPGPFGSESERVTSLPPSSPLSPQANGEAQPQAPVEPMQTSSTEPAKSPSDAVLIISSEDKPPPVSHFRSLSSSSDALSVLLNHGKDFSMAHPAHVSPTLHILDPYSYKLPSITDSCTAPTTISQPLENCRYPVLQYLSPFWENEFGSRLACDLLDTYFSSAFSCRMHPNCHHIHNFIVRRCDILDPNEPRRSHPGLLASMLFVAALSDEALGLFNGPEERDSVCKYLSLLSYRLLSPARYEPLLSQEDLGLPPSFDSDSGWTNDDLRRALDSQQLAESSSMAWGTDYIIALIHVSAVISGSEKKAASIRWYVLTLV